MALLSCDCSRESWKLWLRTNKLLLVTALGVLLGIILGLILRNFELCPEAKIWIKLWGELFLRMLRVLILPIIMSCLVTGVASMDVGTGGRLGVVTLLYVYTSHIVATTFAASMALAIRPGRWWDQSGNQDVYLEDEDVRYTDMFTDFIRNLIPDNIVKACLQNAYTDVSVFASYKNGTNVTFETRKLLYRDGTNNLGVIVFSVAIGFAVAVCKEDGKPLFNVFKSLELVIFKVMTTVLWYSPIGIVSLTASALLEINSIENIIKSVGMYVLTVLLSLIVYHFVIMPLVFWLITRKNPFKFYFHLLEGILAAFAPASSVAAIPGLFAGLKDRMHVDGSVVDFCLPVLLTINKGGSATFIAISVLFVSQSYNMSLGVGALVVIILLTSALCPAVAAIPSSSLVILMTVASTVQVPLGDRLAVIMALEWILDRARTITNVASTGYGCGIIERFCRGKLKQRSVPSKRSNATCESEEKSSFIELNDRETIRD